ncbi:putative zinc finger, C2H2 type [Lyophyllum shimeji]|uniref:Zinc finger, C2H2 type n=1 Tax=Lyophyllum shimeji TaxID=47721 RepID=A0A9P3PUN6_LYOSH|nr:putative zinc finger, C2H2 type [Lyophyllum shimeji]
MKPSAEGLTSSALLQDYGHSQSTFRSLSRSQTSSYADSQHLALATYIPVDHANLVQEHYAADVTFGRRQTEVGPAGFPESSQRTGACGTSNPYPPSYDVMQNVQFNEMPEPAELRTASLWSDPDHTPAILSSSVHHRPGCMRQDGYFFDAEPSDAAASSDRRLPNKTDRPYEQSSFPYYTRDLPEKFQPPPSLLRRNLSQEMPNLQGRFGSRSHLDTGADRASYANLEQHGLRTLANPLHSPNDFSIPMREDACRSSASPGVYDHAHTPVSGPSNTAYDSRSPSLFTLPELVEHVNADAALSSSSEPGPFNPPVKKKKSKMHSCEVCGKKFPRPSGLKTHMNAHNNLKPFPCGFAGCPRTFTVRSNAKRHLRTHGVDTSVSRGAETAEPPYVVGFSTPTVMDPPAPTAHEMNKLRYKLRWMPPSLASRTNAHELLSLSDDDSESEDGLDEAEGCSWRSAPSIRFPPVVPSLSAHDTEGNDHFEERNSYADAPSYPYHPSQVSRAVIHVLFSKLTTDPTA